MRAAICAILPAGLAALVLPFAHAQQTPNQHPFIATWKTNIANQTITIPLVGSGMTIHRGDGTISTSIAVTANHTYVNPG